MGADPANPPMPLPSVAVPEPSAVSVASIPKSNEETLNSLSTDPVSNSGPVFIKQMPSLAAIPPPPRPPPTLVPQNNAASAISIPQSVLPPAPQYIPPPIPPPFYHQPGQHSFLPHQPQPLPPQFLAIYPTVPNYPAPSSATPPPPPPPPLSIPLLPPAAHPTPYFHPNFHPTHPPAPNLFNPHYPPPAVHGLHVPNAPEFQPLPMNSHEISASSPNQVNIS